MQIGLIQKVEIDRQIEKKKEQESAEAISGLKIMSTYMAILIF